MSLKPYTQYKASGSIWLCDIPSHWAVKRLRFVAKLNPSKREALNLPLATELNFLPMEAIGERGQLDLERTRPLSDVLEGYTYFANGDVVFAKVTPCFENGKGALLGNLIEGMGFGTTELTVFRPYDPSDAKFLWWLTSSPNFRGPGKAEMVGAGGLKRVPDQFTADFPVPLPPRSERDAITAYLSQEVGKIDRLFEIYGGEISSAPEERSFGSLLQERRAALISAAVTGKIDVRGLVETAEAA